MELPNLTVLLKATLHHQCSGQKRATKTLCLRARVMELFTCLPKAASPYRVSVWRTRASLSVPPSPWPGLLPPRPILRSRLLATNHLQSFGLAQLTRPCQSTHWPSCPARPAGTPPPPSPG